MEQLLWDHLFLLVKIEPKEAIVAALDSPLLNDNKITGAKNVLLLIVSGTNEIQLTKLRNQ
jgi:cell division GTPase FtsZ